MLNNEDSLVDLDGAEKEISVLTFPCRLGSLLCVFFTEELRHARFSYRIVDDLMSGLPRALCNFAPLAGHSSQPSVVETKALPNVPGENQ